MMAADGGHGRMATAPLCQTGQLGKSSPSTSSRIDIQPGEDRQVGASQCRSAPQPRGPAGWPRSGAATRPCGTRPTAA